jgi:hypothetical protein
MYVLAVTRYTFEITHVPFEAFRTPKLVWWVVTRFMLRAPRTVLLVPNVTVLYVIIAFAVWYPGFLELLHFITLLAATLVQPLMLQAGLVVSASAVFELAKFGQLVHALMTGCSFPLGLLLVSPGAWLLTLAMAIIYGAHITVALIPAFLGIRWLWRTTRAPVGADADAAAAAGAAGDEDGDGSGGDAAAPGVPMTPRSALATLSQQRQRLLEFLYARHREDDLLTGGGGRVQGVSLYAQRLQLPATYTVYDDEDPE